MEFPCHGERETIPITLIGLSDFTVASRIERAVSRAQVMNSSTNGLSVRPLTVMIPAAKRVAGNLSGTTFNPTLLVLNCATELGSIPINRAVATSVTVSCTDNVTISAAEVSRRWLGKVQQ